MIPLSVKFTPDQEDCTEDILHVERMNGQPSYLPSVSSSRQDEGTDLPVLSGGTPEEPVWVDLCDPDPARLEEIRQQLDFSPEVITACFLRPRSSQVTRIDSALVLVMVFAHLAPRSLFSVQELQICVMPCCLLTMHGRTSAVPHIRPPLLPDLRGVRACSTGHLLRLILEEAVQSYETVGTELKRRLLKREPSDQPRTKQPACQRVRKRSARFVGFLRQQRVFLQDVERAGGALFNPDDRARLQWLTERVGVLVRILGERVQVPHEKRGRTGQTLRVILTEREKQTALIGGRFSFQHFTEVDLSGAVFREAYLEGTKFAGVSLRGADFHQANLQGAVFSFCDLWGADFTDARLEGANFSTSFGLSPSMWGYICSHGGVV